MGLAEQIAVGANFERRSYIFTTSINGSGSISLAPSYVILSIDTDKPIRLRLYDTEASLLDTGEIARSFTNTAVSNSIALITDISMSAGSYTMDPAVYVFSDNLTSPTTYYRVENNSAANIIIKYYPIESNTVTPAIGTTYTIPNRRTLLISRSIAATGTLKGTITSASIPNTYLLVSASLNSLPSPVRLRLYSTQFFDVITPGAEEQNRPFSQEPYPEVPLIADILISGSETIYFTPKIIGSNINTAQLSINLNTLRTNPALLKGVNQLYYRLNNLDPINTADITASLHVYALED